jgi:hypothetical protein
MKVALIHVLIIQLRIEEWEDQEGDGNISSATVLHEKSTQYTTHSWPGNCNIILPHPVAPTAPPTIQGNHTVRRYN